MLSDVSKNNFAGFKISYNPLKATLTLSPALYFAYLKSFPVDDGRDHGVHAVQVLVAVAELVDAVQGPKYVNLKWYCIRLCLIIELLVVVELEYFAEQEYFAELVHVAAGLVYFAVGQGVAADIVAVDTVVVVEIVVVVAAVEKG